MRSTWLRRAVLSSVTVGALLARSPDALAYRPFDGTDAAVAAVGEFELELGPVHYLGHPRAHYLLAPATVLNLGLVQGLELVIDFKNYVAIDRVPNEERVRILDTDVFLKWVVRPGVLQDRKGLSVAIEFGPLTPEINGETTFGASMLVIVSHRWQGGTVHFNQQAQYTRTGSLDLFESIILEGPHDLVVRPVGEIYVEREVGQITKLSGLAGAIWSAREGLDFDMGLRVAREGTEPVAEVRLGLTWAIDVWSGQQEQIGGHGRLHRGAYGRWVGLR